MDKKQFIKEMQFLKEMKVSEKSVDKEDIKRIIKHSIDDNFKDDKNPRGHQNLIIVMEELAELSQAVSKQLRGIGDNTNLLEELADVQLGIYFVQEICGVADEDINRAINVKAERLKNIRN